MNRVEIGKSSVSPIQAGQSQVAVGVKGKGTTKSQWIATQTPDGMFVYTEQLPRDRLVIKRIDPTQVDTPPPSQPKNESKNE